MIIQKPMKVAVINRSFWPVYPVIGEALLRFTEETAQGHTVSVVMQGHSGIKDKLVEASRGEGVQFYPVKAFTTSASISLRVFEAVFFMLWVLVILLWARPNRVYISTDPPIVVPFIVMLYSQLFRAEYIYHLQDIHPEAANVIMPVNKLVYEILLKMDALTMRKAKCLITITEQMALEIDCVLEQQSPFMCWIILPFRLMAFIQKSQNFRVLLLRKCRQVAAHPFDPRCHETYFERGGCLEFTFAGGGVFADRLKVFADMYSHFHYVGLVSSAEAAQINANYTWALLPIEDDVTRFAFPSKSSSYVFSGANILAVCGEATGVAQWVQRTKLVW